MSERKLNKEKLAVKHLLELEGYTQAALARELGLTISHVHRVVIGDRRSPRVEAAIEKIIGRPPREVLAEFEAQAAA